MVYDPLQTAIDITKEKSSGIQATVSDQTTAVTDAAQAKLDALAKYKDPEFVKKEIEAKLLATVADKQEEVLAKKAEIEKKLSDTITAAGKNVAIALEIYYNFPPKLPVINAKALAKKAYEAGKKQLRELKQSASKENLSRGKKTFKYSIKPKELSIPKIPEIPEVPEIPKPQLP